MADDAVIRLGYDNTKVRAGARETEAIMQKTAGSTKAKWNAASKDMKDVFEPMSRGALVNAGAVGVAMFGARMAIGTLISTVDRLSKADYLSAKQSSQMQVISDFFTEVSQRRDEMFADIITGVGDMMTGGAVSSMGDMEQQAAAREKTTRLQIELESEQEKRRTAAIDDEAKLTALKEKQLILDKQIVKARGDQQLKLMIQREKLGQDADQIQRSIDDKKASRDKSVQDAAEKFERTVVQNSLASQGKLAQLTARRAELESRISQEKDAQATYELMTEKENVSQQIAGVEKERDKKAGDYQAGLAEMEARAAGKNKLADKIARDNKLVSRAREIGNELGLSPEDALGVAQKEQSLQDRIDKRKDKGGRISGYGRDQHRANRFIDHRSFGEFFSGKRSDRIGGLADPDWNRNLRGGSKMETKKAGEQEATTLLERIAQGMERLTSY